MGGDDLPMDVMILSDRGIPPMCETEGCGQPASSVWSSFYGPAKRSCERHNPMANVTLPLPVNFTSQSLCQACGQPVRMPAPPQD